MIGGYVVQRVGDRVEVLDPSTFGRLWRQIDGDADVKEGDRLWWQMHRGYRTRVGDEDFDVPIGRCYPAAAPTSHKP